MSLRNAVNQARLTRKMSLSFMPPRIMPICIIATGPMARPMDFIAEETMSGSRIPVMKRKIPTNTAMTLMLRKTLLSESFFSPLTRLRPWVQTKKVCTATNAEQYIISFSPNTAATNGMMRFPEFE